jgi:hypothetical protein
MTKIFKLEIQNIAEKILQKHNIDPTVESYFLKLRMPSYDDLVLEKEGEQILVGHYYHHPSGDLISDPILALDYNQGYWFPVRIELALGITICSFMAKGKRMKYPTRIKKFDSFQRMFARNIRDQKWLENGEKVDD